MLDWYDEAIVGIRAKSPPLFADSIQIAPPDLSWETREVFSRVSHHTSCYQPPVCYGRGAGVGRGLGVDPHIPVHGVGVGVGVGVAVAVGVAVGVCDAVGVAVGFGVRVAVAVGVGVGLGAAAQYLPPVFK